MISSKEMQFDEVSEMKSGPIEKVRYKNELSIHNIEPEKIMSHETRSPLAQYLNYKYKVNMQFSKNLP